MKQLFFSILFLSISLAQIPAQTAVENFINHDLLRNSTISLLVRDLDTGETVAEYRATNSAIPASTIKLVTAATALELLGPNYRFRTQLQISGTIDKNGVLHGNLYIFGGGDPTLGSARVPNNREFLSGWSREIRRAGIKRINGSVVGDASLFDNEGINPQWTWETIGNSHASGTFGISYMDNTARVHFNSGARGTTPTITRVVPEIPGLMFQNNLTSTAIGRDSANFSGAPLSNVRAIHGEIPENRPNFTSQMDIPDPALLLAQHLHNRLIADGVAISNPPTATYQPTNNAERQTIHTHHSLPLSWISAEINMRSNNHYSEHVFRYLALQQEQIASINGAMRVIHNHWEQRGLPVDQLFMFDGSGLSRVNNVSAEFLVQLLEYMQTQSEMSDEFFESLPIGGESGTIARIFARAPLGGNTHAKSGSLRRIRGYAGYINLPERNLTFAVLVNHFNAPPAQIIREIENFLIAAIEENQN